MNIRKSTHLNGSETNTYISMLNFPLTKSFNFMQVCKLWKHWANITISNYKWEWPMIPFWTMCKCLTMHNLKRCMYKCLRSIVWMFSSCYDIIFVCNFPWKRSNCFKCSIQWTIKKIQNKMIACVNQCAYALGGCMPGMCRLDCIYVDYNNSCGSKGWNETTVKWTLSNSNINKTLYCKYLSTA